MKEERFIEIATKVSENKASDEEIAVFLFHIDAYSKSEPQWEQLDPKVKSVIQQSLRKNILASINKQPDIERQSVPVRKLWPRFAIAASIILLVGTFLFFHNLIIKENPDDHSTHVSDVSPGKVGATLTLSNGKKIRLSEMNRGEIAVETGVRITKNEKGEIIYEMIGQTSKNNQTNSLTTARGETYAMILPDKSKVWLNASSTLVYSIHLKDKGKRSVKLQGEAYFEIFKDKAHPFVVESAGQQIEVLGTHFNVNTYPDENSTKTTLLEGSIKILANGQSKLLKPGQQALLIQRQINISNANIAEAIAWKNGNFVFNGDNIEVVMRTLQRWYDIEVIYQGQITDERYYADISRSKNISQILKSLEKAQGVHFKIEGRRVTVTE